MPDLSVMALAPWAFCGVSVLFALIFVIVAFRGHRRASKAEDRVDALEHQLGQLRLRAEAAEAQIAEATQRATIAEQRVGHAEERVEKARAAAKAAEARAAEAERRAEEAHARARDADASLQARRDEAAEKARQSEARARSLLDWAKGQWESRREQDRQSAQGQQGSFQAQLDAYLELRRAPVSFLLDGEIDRLAGPLLTRFATEGEVHLEGDVAHVRFPVDPSKGFRA